MGKNDVSLSKSYDSLRHFCQTLGPKESVFHWVRKISEAETFAGRKDLALEILRHETCCACAYDVLGKAKQLVHSYFDPIRTYWGSRTRLTSIYSSRSDVEERFQTTREKATLIGSLCDDGLHAPVIDIDYDAELVPSSTPGHFHLFLNKKIPFDKYLKVLRAMDEAGLIDPGFYAMAAIRKQTFVRKPGIEKGKERVG